MKRKPTIQDIDAVWELIYSSDERKIVPQLARILRDICPGDYKDAYAIARNIYCNPHLKGSTIVVDVRRLDTQEVILRNIDLASIETQWRTDMITAIWNSLRAATDDVRDL